MGKAASVISTIASVALPQPFGTIAGIAGSLASNTKKDKSAANAAAAYEAQAEQLRKAQELEDRNRRERTRRQIASERAGMAARGIDSESGSGAALLEGIAGDGETGVEQSHALLDLRLDDLDRRKRNLLDAARDSRETALVGSLGRTASTIGRILGQGRGGSTISLLGD